MTLAPVSCKGFGGFGVPGPHTEIGRCLRRAVGASTVMTSTGSKGVRVIRHAEAWAKIGAVELEEGEGYNNVTVEVTTVGGVRKLIRLSESEASWLAAQVADALACRPPDTRVDTFNASILAKGRPAPSKD